MENPIDRVCPECGDTVRPLELAHGITRREMLRSAATAAVTTGAAVVAASIPAYADPRLPSAPLPQVKGAPESLVKTLYGTLTEAQKKVVALSWDNPLRKKVDANWAIVEPTIGTTFTREQQEIIETIFRGVTAEEWYPKFQAQMKTDSGGGIEQYHMAIFGDPRNGKSEWVMTGRHMTIRAGGDPSENMAFGGPIFYGHAPEFNEKPGHPGNVFWYQAKRANEVYQMLEGKQRETALIALAPNESAVSFRKPGEPLPGVRVGDLSHDQKAHVQQVMADVLAPYRKKDVDDVLADVKANGGLDAMHLAFYKQDDLGNDGVWDIWRMEGPAFVWHFRGAPHVHTWVNIAKKA